MRSKLISIVSFLVVVFLASVAVAGGKTLHSGDWQKKTYGASGSWKIVQDGGKRYIELSDDFKVPNAPDLKIFLSPLTASQAASKTATKNSVLVARLPRAKGASRVEIPAGVNLDDFQSVLIHCQKYTKLFAASPLS